ncbi:hypothetical protein AAG570_002096 [Ranatra chinensis]|uniref:Uncharacterized protein n=1 Tax=Ranatra chinensis TaxID=642074 RepID=A0ABD0YWX6_9HEMI
MGESDGEGMKEAVNECREGSKESVYEKEAWKEREIWERRIAMAWQKQLLKVWEERQRERVRARERGSVRDFVAARQEVAAFSDDIRYRRQLDFRPFLTLHINGGGVYAAEAAAIFRPRPTTVHSEFPNKPGLQVTALNAHIRRHPRPNPESISTQDRVASWELELPASSDTKITAQGKKNVHSKFVHIVSIHAFETEEPFGQAIPGLAWTQITPPIRTSVSAEAEEGTGNSTLSHQTMVLPSSGVDREPVEGCVGRLSAKSQSLRSIK